MKQSKKNFDRVNLVNLRKSPICLGVNLVLPTKGPAYMKAVSSTEPAGQTCTMLFRQSLETSKVKNFQTVLRFHVYKRRTQEKETSQREKSQKKHYLSMSFI